MGSHAVLQSFRTEDYEGEDYEGEDVDRLASRDVEHDASVEIRDRTTAPGPGGLQGRGQPVVAGSEAVVAGSDSVVAGSVPSAAVVGASPSLGAAAACCDCAHASAIFQ